MVNDMVSGLLDHEESDNKSPEIMKKPSRKYTDSAPVSPVRHLEDDNIFNDLSSKISMQPIIKEEASSKI